MAFLSAYQRKKLKEHKYCSEGVSLFEQLFLKRFWRWLVLKFPLWVAPNTITLTGFVIMLFTTLCVLLQDLNCEGKAPKWAYLLCAIGIFVYQTLDGIDGPQARRTGTSSPLGEYFDHGLDAITTFIYAAVAACIPGLQEYPFFLLVLVAAMIHINYVYHWQTYVSGVLYFKFVDVSEAHYAQIVALLLTYFLGDEVWYHHTLAFLGIDLPLKYMFVLGTLFFSIINILSAYHIVLTRGVGKNGSTLADTSVLSPIISPLISMSVALLYSVRSPEHLLQNHCLLFLTVFFLPMTKCVIWMMIAAMTKSPYPLLDSIMIGPLMAYANIYFGSPMPELYVALAIAGYNVLNITWTWIALCWEISDTLGVPCFSIPPPTVSPNKKQKLNGSSNQVNTNGSTVVSGDSATSTDVPRTSKEEKR